MHIGSTSLAPFSGFKYALRRFAARAGVLVATSLYLGVGAHAIETPTVTLTPSSTAVNAGDVVTFTATVTAAGNTKVTRGVVRLCDATAPSCTGLRRFGEAPLVHSGGAPGTATFRLRPPPGTRQYKAMFLATPNATPAYNSNQSLTAQVTVTVADHPTAVSLAPPTGGVGNYTLNATVTAVEQRPYAAFASAAIK